MIKSMKTRWTGHAARMGKKRNAYRILMGKPQRERILKWILERWDGMD
jgi:hypothetical protein